MTDKIPTLAVDTPIGLLKFLVSRNEHGVWFVRVEDKYVALPRWIWAHCEKAFAGIGGGK